MKPSPHLIFYIPLMHPHLEAGESQRRKQLRKLPGLKKEATGAISSHVEVLSQLLDAGALMSTRGDACIFCQSD